MEILTAILKWVLGNDFASLLMAVAVAYGAFKVPKSIHDEKRSAALKSGIKSILPKYMASEEGIVWSDYPNDKENIVTGVARKLGIDEPIVREILDELHSARSI